MSKSARSVYLFSFYLFGMATLLLFVPNVLLSLTGMPETDEVWIRVTGALAAALGYYYFRMSEAGNQTFIQLTIHARIFVFIAFTAFVVLKLAHPMLVVFGIVDLAAAGWTWFSIRQDAAAQ